MRHKWTPSARPAPQMLSAIEAPAVVVEAPRPPVPRPIEETVPDMTDKELGALRENAVRLASDNGPRKVAAERLLPLIDSELEKRRARPAPVRASSPVKRVARKATAKAK